MTAHRRPDIPYSEAPRGECRWCGKAILHEKGEKRGEPNLRRRWHPDCVEQYMESDPREARRRVRKRDRGLCATCGVDTYAVRRAHRGRGSTRKLRELGYKPRKSLWELDHVLPLIDGGSHDLANLQTLCTPCHKRKTAEEASARRDTRQRDAEDEILARADATLAGSEALLAELGAPSGSGRRPEEGAQPREARASRARTAG